MFVKLGNAIFKLFSIFFCDLKNLPKNKKIFPDINDDFFNPIILNIKKKKIIIIVSIRYLKNLNTFI